ncbi:hypothetical protein [Legionella fairfieldensis]|uniref:hypothetical protein n=1 Tax=Legionella fairfieldensis TaxID=45064 RepID=UPI00068819A3|nr:hypothetical protein [Legionella fairfieldensis]
MSTAGSGVNWLVDDIYHVKALIRYEIKQWEMQLKKVISNRKTVQLKAQEVAKYCAELVLLYENFQTLLEELLLEEELPSTDYYSENTPARCYVKIQRLKQQLYCSWALKDEFIIVHKLKNYYQHLGTQLELIHKQSASHSIQSSVNPGLKALLNVHSPAELLPAFVTFANEVGGDSITSLPVLAQLNDDNLLLLVNLFNQQRFLIYINSLFFYKLNPQQLFQQSLHPEKFVSVRRRLCTLYYFIETIHQTIMQQARQRGISEGYDYLFHGDELPPGVIIEVENEIRDLIITTIKTWRAQILISSDELINKNKLYDLFRAYKFWFNPNRLIDTVIILKRCLLNEKTGNDMEELSRQMQALYQQLSTTECLDLYGYFANKDSCYLMDTLAAAAQGRAIAALTPLNQTDRHTIGQIYRTLDCVMEALRAELANRHIVTVPYRQNVGEKAIKPGRRNLNAVLRIIELYGDQKIYKKNQTLEQLFKEIEQGD